MKVMALSLVVFGAPALLLNLGQASGQIYYRAICGSLSVYTKPQLSLLYVRVVHEWFLRFVTIVYICCYCC